MEGVLPFNDADAVAAAVIEGRDDDVVDAGVAVRERDDAVAVAAAGVRDDDAAVAVAAAGVRDDEAAVTVAVAGARDDDDAVAVAAVGVRNDDDAVAVDAVGVRGDAVAVVDACVAVGGVDDVDAAVGAGDQWPVAKARWRGVRGPRHAGTALRRGSHQPPTPSSSFQSKIWPFTLTVDGRLGSGRRVKGTTFPQGSVTMLVVGDADADAVDTAADVVGVSPICSIRGFLFFSVVGGLIGDAPANDVGARRVGDVVVDAAVGDVEVAVVDAAAGAAEAILFCCFLQEG